MRRSARGEAERDRQDPSADRAKTLVPERLWTPWRMRYVVDGTREVGCIFCNRLAEDDDAKTLILHRGERAFVIMNLFPYNTGHVMIVPTSHVASLENADPGSIAAMCELRAPALRALRRALSPEGFNLGLNVGAVAGAGVADHLHEHVVPRWQGDANFMPILASTMVMPELIPVTYAKLRAEFEREFRGAKSVVNVVLSDDRQRVLAEDQISLPRVFANDGESLWRAALHDSRARGAHETELIGWAGESRAGSGPIALLHRTRLTGNDLTSPEYSFAKVDRMLAGPEGAILRIALERFDEES
jgi:ATP adenylyltransferase